AGDTNCRCPARIRCTYRSPCGSMGCGASLMSTLGAGGRPLPRRADCIYREVDAGDGKLLTGYFVENRRQIAFLTICLHNSRAWNMAEGYPGRMQRRFRVRKRLI